MQRMVANETGPGSFCCLSWQSVPWLVLPALELTGCQAPCAWVCMYVCTLVRVCGLASRSSAETNALATQGWNFSLCFFTLVAGCGRPGQSPPFWGFLKSVFLLQPMGFRWWSFVSKALAGQWHFLKRAKGFITHSVCMTV